MSSVQYQALLGDTSILADYVDVDVMTVTTARITKQLRVDGVAIVNELQLPNGAHDGYVLTSDSDGLATWQPDPNTLLDGDAIGQLLSNRVDTLAGGTIPVDTVVTLDAMQTMTNKSITGMSNDVSAMFLQNANKTWEYAIEGAAYPTDGQLLTFDETAARLKFLSPAIPVLAGDTSGPATANTVNSVGGSAASDIHSAELLANAATSANTASATVKRDASGNFSAGTITADLSGNATSSSSMKNGSTWTIPFGGTAPSPNQVLTYNGTNASWTTPTTATGVTTATPNTLALRDSAAGSAFNEIIFSTLRKTVSGVSKVVFNAVGQNTLVGASAGGAGTGSSHSVLGYLSGLYLDATSVSNSLFGTYCGAVMTSASYNTGVGQNTLNTVATGSYNTAVGHAAGAAAGATTNNCTLLGALTDASPTGSNYTNSSALGYAAQITANNQIVLGNSSVTSVITSGALTSSKSITAGGATGTSTWSDETGYAGYVYNSTNSQYANGLIVRNRWGGAGTFAFAVDGFVNNVHTPYFIVDSSGKVGIGKTTPSVAFDVVGAIATTGNITSSAGSVTAINLNASGGSITATSNITSSGGTVTGAALTATGPGVVTCGQVLCTNNYRLPANNNGAAIMEWNASGGGAETDFINQVPSSGYIGTGGAGFNYYTQVAGGNLTQIAKLDSVGNLSVNGTINGQTYTTTPSFYQAYFPSNSGSITIGTSANSIAFPSYQGVGVLSSSSTNFIASIAGYYKATFNLDIANALPTTMLVTINGSTIANFFSNQNLYNASYANQSVKGVYIFNMNVGDTFALKFQCTGGPTVGFFSAYMTITGAVVNMPTSIITVERMH